MTTHVAQVHLDPPVRQDRYGPGNVAWFELAKILTLRSTAITFGLTIVAGLAVTALVAHSQLHVQFGSGFDPTSTALSGMIPVALTGGVFGAMLITGEYASGTIRTTLAAAPRRLLLLGVKTAVTAAVMVAFCEAMSFSAFFLGQAILSAGAPTASLGSPGAARAVTLTGVCIALMALMSFGFGLALRNTAAAIAAFVGVVFVLPLVMQGIDPSLIRFLPTHILTRAVMSTVPVGGGPGGYPPLGPGVGLLMMAVYAAIALGVGAVVFVRRDA